VLVFIGIKMLLAEFWHMPVYTALAVVAGVLLLSVLASLIYPVSVESVPTEPNLTRKT
jgi:tellurite resistance protein TerC